MRNCDDIRDRKVRRYTKSETYENYISFIIKYSYKIVDGIEVKDGEYSIFCSDVLLEKGRYRNGKRTGTRFIYRKNKNGELYVYSTIDYRAGKRSGVSYGFYETGSLRFIINYSGGHMIGASVSFTPDGKIINTLSTTVTNRTSHLMERVGIHHMSGKDINGIDEYNSILEILKKHYNDVWFED